MTDGRFETVHNLRPKNWDGRRHWTNWHHLYDFEKEQLERESCPLHDLRSGGQFQYEDQGGGGTFQPSTLPNRLNDRPCGDRMDFAKGRGTQIGGLGDIPLDVDPGRPVNHNKHPGKTTMFTKKNPLKRGLFSEYPYIHDPVDDGAAAHDPRGGVGGMRTGRVDGFGQVPEWIADPYNDKINRGRIYHFKAGPLKHGPEDRPPWMPEGGPERRRKRACGAFYAGKPPGIINDIEWIPDPFIESGVRKQARPFCTWHTKTKWSMPTHAPWTTGKVTGYEYLLFSMVAARAPCRSLLRSFRRPVLRRVLAMERRGSGCRCHGSMNTDDFSTARLSRATGSGAMSIRKGELAESPSAIPQEVTTSAPDHVNNVSCSNLWQEVVFLLSDETQAETSKKSSLLSLLSMFPHSTKKTVEGSVTNVVTCDSLISTLLYYGHGEYAFTVWRTASAALGFSPSPSLLKKLSAYTLLVDGKAQEALDLVALAELLSVKEEVHEMQQGKHFALWATFYAALLRVNAGVSLNEIPDLRGGVKKLLGNLQLLLKEGHNQFLVGALQLTLHAVLSLKLREGRGGILEGLVPTSCDTTDDPNIACLLRVADLLTVIHANDEDVQLFSSVSLPFLLESLFPTPMVYSSRDYAPVFSGLIVYQSFFDDSDGSPSLSAGKSALHSPSIMTVGTALLQQLQLHDLLKSFLHSVVLYDLTKTDKPLMKKMLGMFVGSNSAHTLSRAVGRQFLSAVEMALETCMVSGTLHLLVLGYVSRVLAPLVDLEPRPGKKKVQVSNICSGCNSRGVILAGGVFCVELLGEMMNFAPRADLKAWRRLVLHMMRTIKEEPNSGIEGLSSSFWIKLHVRWWLPELLTMVSAAREHQLISALHQERHVSLPLTEQWDSVARSIVCSFQERVPCDGEAMKTFQRTQIVSDVVRIKKNSIKKDNLTTLGTRHSNERALVRRFVRWEWLLKGLWQLTHESDHDRCSVNLENLLEACISTLNRCRSFRRHDIARDLVGLLLLPAAPFLTHVAPPLERLQGSTILALLVSAPGALLKVSGSPMRNPYWRLLELVSHWLPVPQGWHYMQELLLSSPHRAPQLFLMLRNLMDDLPVGEGRCKTFGLSKQLRVQNVFDLYEDICRCDCSLRTPQLLVPLACALRQAGLVQCLSTLVENTFSNMQYEFQGPWQSSVSRLVEDRLLFLHAYHDVAVAQMRKNNYTDTPLDVSNANRNTALGMVAAFAEAYIFALWEHDNISMVEALLLKPSSQGTNPAEVMSLQPSLPPTSVPERVDVASLFLSVDLAFLLPLASREALRILLLLALAQRHGNSSYLAAVQQLPRCRANPAKVLAHVQRFVAHEEALFSPFANMAVQVATGTWRLRDACVAVAESRKESGGGVVVPTSTKNVAQQVFTVSDLNRCIDAGDWVTALRIIPHVFTNPLHMSRKALLACEKSPKGSSWQGAIHIFLNARLAWQQDVCDHPSRYRVDIGLHESGRVMTLLANAHRWSEALHIFEILGTRVDSYLFSQACYALRAGGRPELAVDLWAMWRAAVGDAVAPTAQMCRQFLRCGVVGDAAVASAACLMVREAATIQVELSASSEAFLPSRVSAPCAVLPVSWEEEESAIVALLRDRWHESWQEALRVALVSGRPKIIREVARNSPRNHHLFKSVMNHTSREHLPLSFMERSAIAGHLDIRNVLDAATMGSNSGSGAARELLQNLLGAEDN